MWSFRKIIIVTLFLISACGYSPLYNKQNFYNFVGKISIQEPNNQNDFIFYSHLIDRFSKSNREYTLTYAITTSKKESGLNFDGTVHRVEISGSVAFSLKDTESEVELLSDNERMYLSYSNFGSTAAVLNAERTINKQLMVLLADKVADRISLIIVEKGS